MIAVSDKVLN